MASPTSAQSEWMGKELGWWVTHREIGKLLIVLSDGDLTWHRDRSDLGWTRTTAIPQLLKGRFQDEPLYVDLRWAHDAGDLTLANPRFLDIDQASRYLPLEQLTLSPQCGFASSLRGLT